MAKSGVLRIPSTMLLKFTTTDMLNTGLIDVASGERAYEIVTVTQAGLAVECSSSDAANSSSFTSSSSVLAEVSPLKEQDPSLALPTLPERRLTTITDASGQTVAQLSWTGRHPQITISDEKVGGLTDLFGSNTVRFMPKMLVIPTRFDTEYIWTATAESLTLVDYDSDTTKGTFYQNTIRIPMPLKSKLSRSQSKLMLSANFSKVDTLCSQPSLTSTSYPSSRSLSETPNSTFIPTHVPGLGSNYLEFTPHPLAHDVEIIISFLMMEILRRGRFGLTPYMFDCPKMWQLKEARDLVLRRFRRNTV